MSDNGTEKKLSGKQLKAIEYLLLEGDAQQAAQRAGVGRSTLYRWLQDPLFTSALTEAQQAALERLSAHLVALADQAAGVLGDVLASKDAGQGHKLRAADIVLSNLLKLRELVTIESRLAELEKRQNESQP